MDVAAGVVKIEKRKHLWQCQDMWEKVSTKRSKVNEVVVLLLDSEWVNKGKQNAKRKGDHNKGGHNTAHYHMCRGALVNKYLSQVLFA